MLISGNTVGTVYEIWRECGQNFIAEIGNECYDSLSIR